MNYLIAIGIFVLCGIIIWAVADYLNRHFFKFDKCVENISAYFSNQRKKRKKI